MDQKKFKTTTVDDVKHEFSVENSTVSCSCGQKHSLSDNAVNFDRGEWFDTEKEMLLRNGVEL